MGELTPEERSEAARKLGSTRTEKAIDQRALLVDNGSMVALSCPHCGNTKDVIRFGYNRSGTARCRCDSCKKTFTLSPKNRGLTPEKEAAIERALAERISQQGIARMLKVGRDTIRKVRKKGHSR